MEPEHQTGHQISWTQLEHQTICTVCACSFYSDAVRQISGFMGMQPCERSDKVEEDKRSHTLLLAGVYRGGHEVLVRAKLAHSQGVSMKITVRSDDLIAAETIAAAIG